MIVSIVPATTPGYPCCTGACTASLNTAHMLFVHRIVPPTPKPKQNTQAKRVAYTDQEDVGIANAVK